MDEKWKLKVSLSCFKGRTNSVYDNTRKREGNSDFVKIGLKEGHRLGCKYVYTGQYFIIFALKYIWKSSADI